MQNPQDVQLAANTLLDSMPFNPENKQVIGLILGTGLSTLADRLLQSSRTVAIPFANLPGFPPAGVESHEGRFLAGELEGCPILIQQGRCHLYEGRTPAQVCMGVRVMWLAGIKKLILTNAAGALNPLFETGSLMCMSDYINHTGVSPLTGENYPVFGPRFPDMSAPFSPDLRKLVCQCALNLGIKLYEGVYIGVHGPEMETPAETRMYRQWGADAIGMSTVLEVIAARHLGMELLGISCLTNKNLPDCMEEAPLEQIIAQAQKAGVKLGKLIAEICPKMMWRK